MKNHKGFTLVEILAVIIILALLSAIMVPIVGKLLKSNEEALSQKQIDNIIVIAKKYAVEHSEILPAEESEDIVELDLDTLIAEGYLDKSSIVDPKTKQTIYGYVNIYYDSNYNQYQYEFVVNDSHVTVGTEYLFSYVSSGENKEQSLVIPTTGYYKLEVWGASGGGPCKGYGGYSSGVIKLDKDKKLFINVGGSGTNGTSAQKGIGGYNGGGSGGKGYGEYSAGSGGGGATSIALVSGTLSSLEQYKGNLSQDGTYYVSEKILIVSGGGAGGTGWCYENNIGGAGGGIYGNEPISSLVSNPNYSASQISGYSFGLGMDAGDKTTFANWGAEGNGGGGGGFYGGSASSQSGQKTSVSGGGGSGYIGNSNLIDGVMYCYDCVENGNVSTKTISTTGFFKDSVSCPNGYSGDASSNCAKSGDGYAKLTYIGKSYSSSISSGTSFAFSYVKRANNQEQLFHVPKTGYYKLEVWGAQGGTATSLRGGYGGYSSGVVSLTQNDILYVNVGGKGSDSTAQIIKTNSGGYNGGGNGYTHRNTSGTSGSGGGGATHIALSSGTLASFDADSDGVADADEIGDILIVAGGGGGTHTDTDSKGYSSIGGAGGGYVGGTIVQTGSCSSDCTSYSYPSGGTQSGGGSGVTNWSNGTISSSSYVGRFGIGATGINSYGGGGGGFYGGASGQYNGGGGGSGYIDYSGLSNGVMYCYGCDENSSEATRTISTTGSNKDSINCPDGYSDAAVSNCAKSGDGYAIITYIGGSLN